MLTNFKRPKMKEYNAEAFWFQQDGATHIQHVDVMPFWKRFFPIPDLSICDFFLLGYVKTEIYKHSTRTQQELKEAIHEQIPIERIVEPKNVTRQNPNK